MLFKDWEPTEEDHEYCRKYNWPEGTSIGFLCEGSFCEKTFEDFYGEEDMKIMKELKDYDSIIAWHNKNPNGEILVNLKGTFHNILEDIRGEIQVEGGKIYILHNSIEFTGASPFSMKNYNYSWKITLDANNILLDYTFFENLRVPEDLDEIKVGDTIEIVNNGQTYTTYKDWINANAEEYTLGDLPNNGDKGVVRAIAPHGECIEEILYGVEINKGYLTVINEKGIKLSSSKYKTSKDLIKLGKTNKKKNTNKVLIRFGNNLEKVKVVNPKPTIRLS